MPKQFDLVVHGATGFTGRLVVEYLLQRYPNGSGVRWAMGGRSADKLAAVRDEVGAPKDTPLVVTDSADADSLRALMAQTRLVLTTVGPYQLYGNELVAACAQSGVDYVDLCGEPAWMRTMIDAHEAQARASGARIVFSCGFDSIPFDLGVWMLQNEMRARFGTLANRVRARVRKMKGTFSGGTAASLNATMAAAQRDPRVLELLRNPFSLTPGFAGPRQPSGNKPMLDEELGVWVAPFVMAAINTRNVHRTNFLLAHAYGTDFVYDEMMVTGAGEKGEARANAVAADKSMDAEGGPKPGEGPSRQEREAGYYDVLFLGRNAAGDSLRVGVTGDRDPGYGSTSKMITEAAVCLLQDVPDTAGGIWTPASVMGTALIERLRKNAGLRFAVESDLASFHAARELLFRLRTDQPQAVRQFRWPVMTEFNWALDHFDAIARDNHRPGLWIVGEDGSEIRRTFAELSLRSAQVANYLRGLGVRRGDHLLLLLGNELPLWETMLAAIKLGAVLIPASTLLTTEDIDDRIERGSVKHVVAGHVQTPKFAPLGGAYTRISVGGVAPGWHNYDDSLQAPTDFVPDGVTRATDPLLLYFTSGTTSKPKLVSHTHQSYPVGHLSTMYWLGLRPGDVHLNISSPGWAKHAWSCFFAPWNAGACIFIYNSARFDARGLLSALVRHGVTSLCAPPTVWRMLIQEDLASYRGRLQLRELIGAGEPLNPEIIERVRLAWGLDLRDGYGQTETTAQIGNAPGQPLKPGSMGRPLPGYTIALLDPDGRPADEGEVCIDLRDRPTGLMAGYRDSAEKNAEAMRDGYYHTGDVATRDAEGYITFVGRTDDVFKASDYRISPFELESVLMEHEAVAEVAVIPSPDPVRLAVPKAYLILVAGAQPSRELAQAVFAFARQQLAPYKRVRRIEFVTELPKTISGKIRRVQLRAQEVAQRASGARTEGEFFEEDFA